MFCDRCGNALIPGAKFCSSCGNRVGVSAAAQPAAPAAPAGRNGWAVGALIVAIALALFVSGIVYVGWAVAVIGIVLGILGLALASRLPRHRGRVMSWIALTLSVLFFFFSGFISIYYALTGYTYGPSFTLWPIAVAEQQVVEPATPDANDGADPAKQFLKAMCRIRNHQQDFNSARASESVIAVAVSAQGAATEDTEAATYLLPEYVTWPNSTREFIFPLRSQLTENAAQWSELGGAASLAAIDAIGPPSYAAVDRLSQSALESLGLPSTLADACS